MFPYMFDDLNVKSDEIQYIFKTNMTVTYNLFGRWGIVYLSVCMICVWEWCDVVSVGRVGSVGTIYV